MHITGFQQTIGVLKQIPKIVKDTIERKNQSWREAGKDSGISHTSLYKIAHGHTQPTIPHVIKILKWAGRD